MAKPLLLILTTNPESRKRLTKDLKNEYELKFCESGREALQSFHRTLPAAVVMDHSLEDFLTYTFIDKVRNNAVTRSLPFVIISRESTHSFVEQAVRAGVSHYIGVPYEPKVLLQKVRAALNLNRGPTQSIYFEVNSNIPTHLLSYGRISYISDEGIHFETHLKLKQGAELTFQSPLSEALGQLHLEVVVQAVSTDVFYNYPFAVDALWKSEEIKKKVHSWILGHRHLNSPKKTKVLFVNGDVEAEFHWTELIDAKTYSLRFSRGMEEAIAHLSFMRPECTVVRASEWNASAKPLRQRFLNEIKKVCHHWILQGESKEALENISPKPFISPDTPESVALALKDLCPPKPVEPGRIYFSKTLEDSHLKIHLNGKVLTVGELGLRIGVEHEVVPPCNFQLDLKTFTKQDLRNPSIRAWPPLTRSNSSEAENGKFPFAFESDFLGINEQQAQAIRQWLIDEELKVKREAIAPVPPAPKPKSDA